MFQNHLRGVLCRGVVFLLLLGVGCAPFLLPEETADMLTRASPRPAALSVGPGLRLFLPPEWAPTTPLGARLSQAVNQWSQKTSTPVQTRILTPAEMQAFLAAADVAPGAMPDLMLVPVEALPGWPNLLPLTAVPQAPGPSWLAYAQEWAAFGWPWAGDSWVLWVPKDQVETWTTITWDAWTKQPWAFVGQPPFWPMWQLYHAAGGAFPPRPDREGNRQALEAVFRLVRQSRIRGALSAQVLDLTTPEDLARAFPNHVWFAGYRNRTFQVQYERVPVFPPSPQGEPGLTLARGEIWLLGPNSTKPGHGEGVASLLQFLYSPQTYSEILAQDALPTWIPSPWPEVLPWMPEDLLRLEPLPALSETDIQRMAQALDGLLRQGWTEAQALKPFLTP